MTDKNKKDSGGLVFLIIGLSYPLAAGQSSADIAIAAVFVMIGLGMLARDRITG